MAHIIRDKKKMLNRIRRIRGQVEAIESAIEREADCSEILHTIAACRGAFNALMAEVLDGHIRFHVVDAKQGTVRAGVDPKSVATLIVACLEGALMMSRIQRSDDALRQVQSHLN